MSIIGDLRRMQLGFALWRSLMDAERATGAVSSVRLLAAEERAVVWLAQQTAVMRSWSAMQWAAFWEEAGEDGETSGYVLRDLAEVCATWDPYVERARAMPAASDLRDSGEEFEGLPVDGVWALRGFQAAESAVGTAIAAIRRCRPALLAGGPKITVGLGAGWEHLESLPAAELWDKFRLVAAGPDGLVDCRVSVDYVVSVEVTSSRWTLSVATRDWARDRDVVRQLSGVPESPCTLGHVVALVRELEQTPTCQL